MWKIFRLALFAAVSSALVAGAGTASAQGTRAVGPKFKVLFQLPAPGAVGYGPFPLMRASDGSFYGLNELTTNSKGGSIYRLTPQGVYQELYVLPLTAGSLVAPFGPLMEGSDHFLYGSAAAGGDNFGGGAFRISLNGEYKVLAQYLSTTEISGPLTEASDGNLYGVSRSGGQFGCGFIFRFPRSGGSVSTVRTFACGQEGEPTDGLTVGPDGALYGTSGSAGLGGVLYRLGLDGSYSVVHTFDPDLECSSPLAAPIFDADGLMYGSCPAGPTGAPYGVIYRLDSAGQFKALHLFKKVGNKSIGIPNARLALGTDGMLYGAGLAGGYQNNAGGIFRVSRDGKTYGVLRVFKDPAKDGYRSLGAPVEGPKGTFYGTCFFSQSFRGTVWSVKP